MLTAAADQKAIICVLEAYLTCDLHTIDEVPFSPTVLHKIQNNLKTIFSFSLLVTLQF